MGPEKIDVKLLCAQSIPNLSEPLREALGLEARFHAIGLVSTDCDDVTYIALDEACKSADVEVAYAKSLYAGASNASTRLAGEVIGILAGPNPDEITSALARARSVIETIGFEKADTEGSVVYLAHCVSACGSYLASLAGVAPGQALAYLIAPPVEAIVGLDAALKASDVRMAAFFPPPSETNFAGGLLAGTQSACSAACAAFAAAVREIAQSPLSGLTGGSYG